MRGWTAVFVVSLMVLAAGVCLAAGLGKDVKADVQATAVPPKIDGDLSDAAWKDKVVATKLVDVYTGKEATPPSTVSVTYDDQNVYIAYDMPEPLVDKIVAQVADHDGQVWQDDAVEIFLDPKDGKAGAAYYQLIVNSKGVIYDGQAKDSSWESKATVAAKVDKEGKKWTLEVAIPLASMGVKGSPKGQEWLANFGRDRQVTGMGENSAWADVGEDFHNWEGYGHITLK